MINLGIDMKLFHNLIYVKNPLADIITYNDRKYYRYMDKIYIPSPPSELNDGDVSSLSEMRIKLNGDVIDYDYTESVIAFLIKKAKINNNSKIIDFGCGSGISADVLSSIKIIPKLVIGLDLCQFAVSTAKTNYSHKKINNSVYLFGNNSIIPEDDNSIDAIISSFVMHFNIYKSQVDELYRVLKKGAMFVYNDYVYHKYNGHSKKIIKSLEAAGFSVETEIVEFKIKRNNIIKKHLIVTAKK